MKMKCQLLWLFGIVGLSDACTSFLQHKCQDCATGGGHVDGASCVVGGEWLGCYPDINVCCNNWEAHNEFGYDGSSVGTCVEASTATSGPDAGPVDPAPNKPWWEPGKHQVPVANPRLPPDWNNWPMVALPTPSTSGCYAYVSIVPGVSNSACQEFCESGNHGNLEGFCKYEYWGKTDGWARFTADGCYDNFIYGYSDEGNYGSGRTDLGGYTVGVTETPQQCQTLCQENGQCVHFAWRAHSQDSGIELPVGNCQLKYQDVMDHSVGIPFPVEVPNWPPPYSEDPRWDWCNMGMAYDCWVNQFTCLACSGNPVCVWVSANHVAGPKYCGQPRSGCLGETPGTPPPTLPPTPPPTLPPTAPPTLPPTPPPTLPPTPAPTTTLPPTPPPTLPPTPAPTTTLPPTPAPTTTLPPTPAPTTTPPPTPAPSTPEPEDSTPEPQLPPTRFPPRTTEEPPVDPSIPCEKPNECHCANSCHNNNSCNKCPCAALSLRVRDKPKFLNLVVKF